MKKLIFDIETTGLNPLTDKIVGFSIQFDNDMPLYFTEHQLTRFKHCFESPEYLKIFHNGKFEYAFLKQAGINMVGPYADTQIAIWLLNEGIPKTESNGTIHYDHKLKHLAKSILGVQDADTFDELAKKYVISEPTGKVRKNNSKKYGYKKGDPICKKRPALASEISPEILGPYCIKDVSLTWDLYQYAEKKLLKQGLWDLFQLECSLIPVLASMERTGVLVDVGYLIPYQAQLQDELAQVEKELEEVAKYPCNLASPKQLGVLLYNKLKLPILKKTPKGKPSTGKAALRVLEEKTQHKIFPIIAKHHDISKILGTYVNRWLDKRDENGRVHFYIDQTATVSGRSGSDAQQIPKRTPNAHLVRRGIIARPGYKLIEADYGQLEPRILAHLSGDKKLIDVFNQNIDMYKATVSAVLKKPLEEVTKEDRDLGKVTVLASNYGQTAWGLARKLNISEEEAQMYLDNYFNYYSGVKVWRMETIGRAKRLGYTETLLKRRSKMSEDITLPPVWKNRYGKWQDVNKWRRDAAEREATNRPIQGSSQDIIKHAMISIFARLSEQSKLLIMVHDSLLFELPANKVTASIPIIRQLMESALPLCIPTPVEIKVGDNLADMTEVK